MENITMTTAIDKTALEQKWVTRDLIHSLEDAMTVRLPDAMMTDNGVMANNHVRKALGGLIAAKAYLWLVSHPEYYADIIRTKQGCAKLVNHDLRTHGFDIDLTVNNSHLQVKVMDTNQKVLLVGECDLNKELDKDL